MSEAEFRELYVRNAGPLKSYLSRLTGNTALAEDLMQESFYRVLRTKLPPLDAAGLRNYLYRTATNLANSHFRSASRRTLPLTEHSCEAAYGERAEIAADLRRELARMNPTDRAMLWLAYVEGESHREIAAITGLKEASVRPMLFRARRRLAAWLEKRGFRGSGVRRVLK